MENASKALLIAAGMFFAMLILTMMMYMSGRITEIGEIQESKRAAEQLAAFNAEYEAYNKKLMYGTDIVTIINKAKEDGITIILNGDTMVDASETLDNVKENIRKAKLDPEDPDYEGLKIYECINVTYDTTTGKVNYMEFKEKPI